MCASGDKIVTIACDSLQSSTISTSYGMLYTGMGHAITPQKMVVPREPRLPACGGECWAFV